RKMSKRKMANALATMANAFAQDTANRTAEREAQENRRANDDELRLQRFMNNKPPIFKGGHDPEGAQNWIEGVERIFNAMKCSEEQKVVLGTYVLHEEAGYWWKNAYQRMGAGTVVITWENFKREFLVKYFPAYVRNRKAIEFMELKQGNLSVAEYSVKFEELSRFCPHYNTIEAEYDKCVKFESGLRPDIKQLIGFSEIRDFATLVNKSKICDDDGKAKSAHYKMMKDKRGKGQDRGKPYDNKGKKKAEGSGGKKEVKCFKCGIVGHKIGECKAEGFKCYRCGRFGHKSEECKN
ncbi:cellular nucleic acid-binding protein, partial [Trifolium pratense]